MKNKKFLLTTVLPITLSLIAGILILTVNTEFTINMKARSIVSAEKKKFADDIDTLKSKKDDLTKQAAGYDETLLHNEQLYNEIEALGTTLNDYVTDIASAKDTIAELDIIIADKEAYCSSMTELQQETEGEIISLKSGDYKCPSQLKAGRYTAEGKGKIYLYSIANTLKEEAIDLATIDTHSYTFNISSGESIKIDGNVTLKKIETQN